MKRTITFEEATEKHLLPRGPTSEWMNPTRIAVTVKFDIGHTEVSFPMTFDETERAGIGPARTVGVLTEVVVVWEPGETKAVPSVWDRAIHKVHNGVIIGGEAPQLVKVGAPPVPVDWALQRGNPSFNGQHIVPSARRRVFED